MVTAALVVMTILGCDDSVSQCHYVDTVKGRWETVAACDSQSQKTLPSYTNASYPVIVAMCEQAADSPIATAAQVEPPAEAAPATTPVTPPMTPPMTPPTIVNGRVQNDAVIEVPRKAGPEGEDKDLASGSAPAPVPEEAKPKPLPRRAYALIRGVLPDRQKIQEVLAAPVHSLGDGYSWVATRLKR